MMAPVRSVCVFCGASTGVSAGHAQMAQQLGAGLAGRGWRLVYGAGGIGLMGEVARACLERGGAVTGIIPQHLMDLEVALPELEELLVVPDMHTRKRMMFERADAFCVLPGGFGTLDETFEILTWKQLGLHDKPVIFCDSEGYWQPLLSAVDSMVDGGFLQAGHRRLFSVAATTAEALSMLAGMSRGEMGDVAANLF